MSESRSAVDDFVSRVRITAEALGLSVIDRGSLAGHRFKGSGDSPSMTLGESDLPDQARALGIGRYTVVFGTLPDTPTLEGVRETLRRYRNQCVVARSFLRANETLDLQLFLVGPRGSEWERQWKSLGLFLERDDRVARKLAWLRPRDAERDAESFGEFVRRSFLARPWNQDDRDEGRDELSLDLDETTSTGLPRNTAEEFDRIALDSDGQTPDEIVDSLIRAWQRRETS